MVTYVDVSGRRSWECQSAPCSCRIWEGACSENWGHGVRHMLQDRAQRGLPPVRHQA